MPPDVSAEMLPSKPYVSLFSWCGLVLGFLRVIGGYFVGIGEIALSAVGLHATWSNTISRGIEVGVFAIGWGVWAIIETIYLLLLLIASSDSASLWFAATASSTTFANMNQSIQTLFSALREDVSGFVVFSACTSVLFDWMAFFWGVSLWADVLEANAVTHPSVLPLIQRQQPGRQASISSSTSFGTFGRPFPDQHLPKKPKQTPFQGRGHRLGGE